MPYVISQAIVTNPLCSGCFNALNNGCFYTLLVRGITMLSYALAWLFINASLCGSLTCVEEAAMSSLMTVVVAKAIAMCHPMWGRYPYLYSARSAAKRCGGVVTPSGFIRLEQQVKGLPVVLELLVNNRQARKIDEVVKHRKDFTVVKDYVIHHGPGAPNDVVFYGAERNMTYVSCNGATHPYKDNHICPTNHPLFIAVIPYDKGWKVIIQDSSPLFE